MANKYGKFIAAAAVLGAGICTVLALKKRAEDNYCTEDTDDRDFDNDSYNEDLFDVDGEFDSDRNYVTIPTTPAEPEEDEMDFDLHVEETADTEAESKETEDDVDFLEDEVDDKLNQE